MMTKGAILSHMLQVCTDMRVALDTLEFGEQAHSVDLGNPFKAVTLTPPHCTGLQGVHQDHIGVLYVDRVTKRGAP